MNNDVLRLEKKIKTILVFGIINVVYGLIVYAKDCGFVFAVATVGVSGDTALGGVTDLSKS